MNDTSIYSRKIAHVDINSYFATLLQQENPYLRGRPVGVVKSEGRGCIIAASKEAKLRGVRTGSRVVDARLRAPDIVLVPAQFGLYLDCTRRLKQLFGQMAPTVDIFSLDEAFIELSDCQRLYPTAQAFGEQVQAKIKQELGEWVTCNVGVSYTRLLAKLASEVSPKGSITQITPENRDGYLATAAFSEVCGVGVRLERRLQRLGVTNLYQLNFMSPEDVETQVGPYWAKALMEMAQGFDSPTLSRIDDSRGQLMKSVGRSITGYGLCDDEAVIKQTIYNLCEEAAHKVRRMDMAGRHIAIYLTGGRSGLTTGANASAAGGWGSWNQAPEAETETETESQASQSNHPGGWLSAMDGRAGGQSWYRHQTLKYYLRHTDDFFHHVYHGFYQNWQRSFPVIKFGVWLSGLKPMDQVPIQLFEEYQRKERVAKAVDGLNDRYGLFTVRPATLAQAELIRPEVTGFLGDKTYYGL